MLQMVGKISVSQTGQIESDLMIPGSLVLKVISETLVGVGKLSKHSIYFPEMMS
jgi:hypothetical protein